MSETREAGRIWILPRDLRRAELSTAPGELGLASELTEPLRAPLPLLPPGDAAPSARALPSRLCSSSYTRDTRPGSRHIRRTPSTATAWLDGVAHLLFLLCELCGLFFQGSLHGGIAGTVQRGTLAVVPQTQQTRPTDV